MSTSPLLSATVLGKRKAVRNSASLVLHLASSPEPSLIHSDSDFEPPSLPVNPSKSLPLPPIIVNGQLVENTKRRYKCTHKGCTKAYTKPSRLEEHERSHTGERPFVCTTCNKSYLRETHLHAHARSHLPESAKPFGCSEVNCEKRFWTTQHLRVHEDMHKGAKPYLCTEGACDEAFAKHHQLRTHICTTHAPEGTKPYRCDHDGCTKSFSTNQKLHTHSKIHDDKRYTCVHPSCLSAKRSSPTYYSTWTSLQHHTRTAHPPTCPRSSCNNRTFASHHALRAHLKLHEEREVEAGLEAGDGNETDGERGVTSEDRPRKKRRGGEMGRDWKCDIEGCEKDFKSKKALTTHHNITHLGKRDHVCPYERCNSAFGYKHLLQRHMAKIHSTQTGEDAATGSDSAETSGDVDEAMPKGNGKAIQRMDIDAITGKAYADHSSQRVSTSKALRCPHPHLAALAPSHDTQISENVESSSSKVCDYVFSRAYDLRRHLRVEHGFEADKDMVDEWVKDEKARIRKESGRM